MKKFRFFFTFFSNVPFKVLFFSMNINPWLFLITFCYIFLFFTCSLQHLFLLAISHFLLNQSFGGSLVPSILTESSLLHYIPSKSTSIYHLYFLLQKMNSTLQFQKTNLNFQNLPHHNYIFLCCSSFFIYLSFTFNSIMT